MKKNNTLFDNNVWYSLIREEVMQDIRFDGKLDYIIDNIEFVNVLRNANYTLWHGA